MYRSLNCRRVTTRAFAGVLVALIAGCASVKRAPEPSSQDEVGKISVGVQSISPFDDAYIRQISPNFTMTTPEALQAISQARIRELETLREVLLAARVDLGARGASVTKITESGTGTETTVKETTTETKTPGTTTSPTIPVAIAATLARLADDEAVNIDAALRYRTAASLIQEVALLNRYVRDAAIARDTVPYVVRFLVTVSPYRRELPYDASINIEMTDTESRGVVIVPLFVTDTIETSREGSLARASSALGGELGGVFGSGIGASLGGSRKQSRSEAIRSRSFNSLFTLAKSSENAIEARLGAAYTGAGFELLSRTYNVTVLALVPVLPSAPGKTFFERQLRTSRLQYRAAGSFRSATSGLAPSGTLPAQTGAFDVPQQRSNFFHSEQNPAVFDNTKTAELTLTGAKDLLPTGLVGKLIVTSDSQKFELVSTSVEITLDGTAAKFRFPSPSALLGKAPSSVAIRAEQPQAVQWWDQQSTRVFPERNAAYIVVKPPPPEAAAAVLTVGARVVRATKDGTGTIIVGLAAEDPSKPPLVRIRVDGADIDTVTPSPLSLDGSALVQGSGRYFLTLRNLVAKSSIEITASLVDGKKESVIGSKKLDVAVE